MTSRREPNQTTAATEIADGPLQPYVVGGPPTTSDRIRDLVSVFRSSPRLIVQATGALAATLLAVIVGAVLIGRGGPPPDHELPMADAASQEAPDAPGDQPDRTQAGESSAESMARHSVPADAANESAGPVHAHVAGAVNQPGMVILEADSRISDLVEAGGGPVAEADLDRINLAAPVEDGARLYVPAVGEEEPPSEVTPSVGGGPAAGEPVEDAGEGAVAVNSATEAELEDLPGVGPATAEAIVAHREQNGPFASVEALESVRGIGPAKLEAMRDNVVL